MSHNMKNDWWFKFEYSKWDDPSLQLCRMETQGFWLRIYIALRKSGKSAITATVEKLATLAGCSAPEATRSVTELKQFDVADVTLGNGQSVTRNSLVTLESRSLKRELSSKEKTRLRVQKHRSNADVTPDVTVQSKSKEKEEIIREEKKPAAIAAPAEDPVERRIWKDGIDLLSKSALTEKQARPFLGRLAKDYGNEKLAEAIAVTQAKNPVDPKVFLIGVLKTGEKDRARMELGKYVPDDKPYIPDPPCKYCGKEICFSLHEEERQKEAA